MNPNKEILKLELLVEQVTTEHEYVFCDGDGCEIRTAYIQDEEAEDTNRLLERWGSDRRWMQRS